MRYQVVSTEGEDWGSISADGVEAHTLFDHVGDAEDVAADLERIYGEPGSASVIERPELVSDDVREEIRRRARATARGFVAEFNEPLDPDETDWDGTAWEVDRHGLDLDACMQDAFGAYQAELVTETERLCNEAR